MTRIQARRLLTRCRRAPWTRQRQSRAQFRCPPPDGAMAQTIRIERWPATRHTPRPVPPPTPRPTRGTEREVYENRSQGRQPRSCPRRQSEFPSAIRPSCSLEQNPRRSPFPYRATLASPSWSGPDVRRRYRLAAATVTRHKVGRWDVARKALVNQASECRWPSGSGWKLPLRCSRN
jgi:hypothetical protein